MKDYSYLVDKYAFQTPLQIEEAKKELEAIAYIRENTDISELKNAVSLYKKLNEKPSFKTEPGLEFMRELYDVIAASGVIEQKNIPPIKVELANPFHVQPASDKEAEKERETQAEKKLMSLKVRHRNLWIVTVFLVGVISVMFYIAKNSDYSHISDYETQLIDKYAGWEEELSLREQAVKEKETELELLE